MKVTSVQFKNFKALDNYSVSLDKLNILVGSNNSGKSTVISAFRALASGLRKARARRSEYVQGPNGGCWGYKLEPNSLPISIENVHTDYVETDSSVSFRLSNGSKLTLFFPAESGCYLIPEPVGKTVKTPSDFRSQFQIQIGIVPVLGPVEHEEAVVTEETVKRELETHRASRHFRNYWRYFPDGFDEFSEMIKDTWPGMEIMKPEKINLLSNELVMFCTENRIDRELYWSGFGFQVWCQMLTHISRTKSDDVLVIDEPDIYLHPDVQRQLISILRDIKPDVIIATHSTEIMSEADPSEILLVDKSKRSAKRLRDVEGVQEALDSLGSVQNITLTQLAKNKRVLFVEGSDDFKRIRRFAKKLDLLDLSAGIGITPIESGGFSSWNRIEATAWGIEQTLSGKLLLAAIFDRDFWCNEEIESILDKLNHKLSLSHVHSRKEMENYLLLPTALQRAADSALAEEAKRHSREIEYEIDIKKILIELTDRHKEYCQSQYIAKRIDYLTKTSSLDSSTIAAETIRIFESKWKKIENRLKIVNGKDILSDLRSILQSEYGINLTDYKIIDSYKKDEIPEDLKALLYELDRYSKM